MKLRQLRRKRPRLECRKLIASNWAKPNWRTPWLLVSVEYRRPDGTTGLQVLHPMGHKNPYDIGHTCSIFSDKIVRPDEQDHQDGGRWIR